MESLNASDAKREFGDLLLKSQNHPIGINKNGKPVAVMISKELYEEFESYRLAQLKAAIQSGVDDLNQGNIKEGVEVFNHLRAKLA